MTTRSLITTTLYVILALTWGSMIDEGESCIIRGGALLILGPSVIFLHSIMSRKHCPLFSYWYNVSVRRRCNTATLGCHSRNCHGILVSAFTKYDVCHSWSVDSQTTTLQMRYECTITGIFRAEVRVNNKLDTYG